MGKPNSTLMDLVVKASGITRNQRCVVREDGGLWAWVAKQCWN